MDRFVDATGPQAGGAAPRTGAGRRLARATGVAAAIAASLAALAACTTSTPRPASIPAGGAGPEGTSRAAPSGHAGVAGPAGAGRTSPGQRHPSAVIAGAPASGGGGGSGGVGGAAGGNGGTGGSGSAVPGWSAASPGGGAYYLDDGPGHHPMPPIETLVDAVPRAEPLHPRANRPYQVFGRDYVPLTERGEFREQGFASWYGRKFHGRPTSTGEPYDMYGMTAAHPTLPLPSYVRVTSLENGRSVVVRVNDRGPFLRGRVIDLSAAAAHRLGYLNAGSARVDVELIGTAATSEGQDALALLGPDGNVRAGAGRAAVTASPGRPGSPAMVVLPVVQVRARFQPVPLATADGVPPSSSLQAPPPPGLPSSARSGELPAAATAAPVILPRVGMAEADPAAVVRSIPPVTGSATGPVSGSVAGSGAGSLAGSAIGSATGSATRPGAAIGGAPSVESVASASAGSVSGTGIRTSIAGTGTGTGTGTDTSPRAPVTPYATAPSLRDDGHFVQLAAFQSRAAADDARHRFGQALAGLDASLRIVEGAAVYRVQAGPYGDRRLANEAAARIHRATGLQPWIVGQP